MAELAHLPEHARILRAVRLQRNWTQLELAYALSVSVRTIKRWENADTEPHPGRMGFIRQLLVQLD